jgi:hypothetical protein
VAKARDAHEVAEGGRLLAKLSRLEGRVEGLLTKAEDTSQLGAASSLCRELRELLRLFGEISGELKGGGGVTVNLLASPTWISVQRTIVVALAPYPEARDAVVQALGKADTVPDA